MSHEGVTSMARPPRMEYDEQLRHAAAQTAPHTALSHKLHGLDGATVLGALRCAALAAARDALREAHMGRGGGDQVACFGWSVAMSADWQVWRRRAGFISRWRLVSL